MTATHVTNSSVTLSWYLPAEMNGVLRNYHLFVNGFEKGHFEAAEDATLVTSYTIYGLESYTAYNLSVVACTTLCSEKSNGLTIRTRVGSPGTMSRPQVVLVDAETAKVIWEQPKPPSGPKPIYQVAVSDGERGGMKYFNFTGARCRRVSLFLNPSYKNFNSLK